MIKNILNSLEVKNITPYQKFSNSFKLVFVIEIEENKTIQEAVRLTNLISTPWLISVDEFTNEVSLVFNKTELSKFKQQHFNVIRWANFEVVDY
ncbi:MAG: hypothetical protein HWD82_02380 [Flavobacteriaceae bacterium]|nr:hypothetical protein [Flavobacteriaceae bacterium]